MERMGTDEGPMKPFQPIASAPKDGTEIEVRHGPRQEIASAEWSGQSQAWIRSDDPLRRSLHQVSVWRPVTKRATPPAGTAIAQP